MDAVTQKRIDLFESAIFGYFRWRAARIQELLLEEEENNIAKHDEAKPIIEIHDDDGDDYHSCSSGSKSSRDEIIDTRSKNKSTLKKLLMKYKHIGNAIELEIQDFCSTTTEQSASDSELGMECYRRFFHYDQLQKDFTSLQENFKLKEATHNSYTSNQQLLTMKLTDQVRRMHENYNLIVNFRQRHSLRNESEIKNDMVCDRRNIQQSPVNDESSQSTHDKLHGQREQNKHNDRKRFRSYKGENRFDIGISSSDEGSIESVESSSSDDSDDVDEESKWDNDEENEFKGMDLETTDHLYPADFDKRIELLVAYYRQHNNFQPPKCKGHARLRRFLFKLQGWYILPLDDPIRLKRLTPERIQRLKQIQYLNWADDESTTIIQQQVGGKISKEMATQYDLDDIEQIRKKCKYSSKVRLIKPLFTIDGYDDDNFPDTFEERYELLKKFYQKTGHCTIPSYSGLDRLIKWTSELRRAYGKCQQNPERLIWEFPIRLNRNMNQLNEERIQLLRDINFQFVTSRQARAELAAEENAAILQKIKENNENPNYKRRLSRLRRKQLKDQNDTMT